MSLNPRRGFWSYGPCLTPWADKALRVVILAAGLAMAAIIFIGAS